VRENRRMKTPGLDIVNCEEEKEDRQEEGREAPSGRVSTA